MARFRVVERSFIGNRIVDVGAVVEIEFTDGGTPGPNLEAMAPEKKGKKGSAPAAPSTGEQTDDDLT